VPIDADGTTGTTVWFRPDEKLRAAGLPAIAELARLNASWPYVSVEVIEGPVG
jgi:topoisomerase-4 subunit B